MKNVNNTPYLVDGVYYSKKGVHGVINPAWDVNQQLKEEMAYAYTKMVVSTNPAANSVTTYHNSTFSDGTLVEIIHKTNAIDPVDGQSVIDHIALLKIVKTYSNP